MDDLQKQWLELDNRIRTWWEGDLRSAQELDIIRDDQRTLLFLPFPYSSAGGSESVFPEMYGWDTFFINLGMLAHGLYDQVRNHIYNQLFMIERYGKVLNGNRTYYLTRSQTPLLAESVRRYATARPDPELLMMAYPLLKREYLEYWNSLHHFTPIGLSTNRDQGDIGLRPELASEAETGLDFCALFGGDIRECAPLLTNCALVKYAQTLGWIAAVLGWDSQAVEWQQEAERRAALIREYCWDEQEGFFFEYNYVRKEPIKVRSLCAYWTLWAGVATPIQAERVAAQLWRFEHTHGLSFTDQVYPSPHPEFIWLQWGYPSGWPPMHIITVEGLDAAGFSEDAERVARKFLALQMAQYAETGKLWEKYNIVDGNLKFPMERYSLPPLHGWSSAAVTVLGRRLFEKNKTKLVRGQS